MSTTGTRIIAQWNSIFGLKCEGFVHLGSAMCSHSPNYPSKCRASAAPALIFLICSLSFTNINSQVPFLSFNSLSKYEIRANPLWLQLNFTGSTSMFCSYGLWARSLLWQLPCFGLEATHLHQRPTHPSHTHRKLPPFSFELPKLQFLCDFSLWVTLQVNGLPFNKYTWIVTHNSFSIVDAPPLPGVQRITFYNQEDSVTNQLRVCQMESLLAFLLNFLFGFGSLIALLCFLCVCFVDGLEWSEGTDVGYVRLPEWYLALSFISRAVLQLHCICNLILFFKTLRVLFVVALWLDMA